MALVAALVILRVYDAMLPQAVLACPGPDGPTYPGTEAYASTITLQMPFIAGEIWQVGGIGSFMGMLRIVTILITILRHGLESNE
jgi:hypothetical protein